MSERTPITDEQKLILHMLMQAEKAGHDLAWISRDDLLSGKCTPPNAPTGVLLKLMWAALAMPAGILEWSDDKQRFRLSEASIENIRRRVAMRLAEAKR